MTPANPLLAPGDLPDFAAVRPEHVTPALDELLAAAEAALELAVQAQVPADYDALARVLDVPVERLRRVWGHVCHLQSVADTPALRAAHAENLPRITDFSTRLASDQRLYAKYKALAASPAAASLSPARRKVLDDALRDFVLGGAELQGAARARFAAIQERLAELSKRFGDNVLDAVDAWALFVDGQRLAGVPADVVRRAREAAAGEGRDGCKLTLQLPCYLPVMQHAEDRTLREEIYGAWARRASELGDARFDNAPLMREIVELRQEEAALLGHPSYAHLSLVPKMARSPEEVLGFVQDLARRARPFAERELAELRDFASRELGIAELQPWDRSFAAERLKQQRYAFGSEEVRPYFTLPRVLEGLFELVGRLFGASIEEEAAPAWHDSVRFFRVRRVAPDGAPVAGFYLDLHARAGKQGGAWMDNARQRWRRPEGDLQLPLANLVCNFAAPVGDQPALLTHDDLITLFHEFGHGLHHMLTQVDEVAAAGIAGVEWDACELPSQFMENFCWEWPVLQRLSSHVDTGEALPRALFDRMLAARNFHNGLAMLRNCEYGLFDMRLHLEPGQAGRETALAFEVAAQVSPAVPAPFLRYPHSFTHLFDGGYAAGYYGYAWAEVLSADAFSAFEEAGLFDAATGHRFREAVLESGGSRAAMESFKAFRGREPRLEALLRHQGLLPDATAAGTAANVG
ncbi:MAG: M3 family metallopeptidase [Burkholderiales bacterium]|nr:M3 family metallopeptidase [Burkholderiales bacterium]